MKAWLKAFDWRELTLPVQFILAGAIVMIIAMALVGSWIAARIEDAVVQNSASSAALFMESFIAPISQELAETETLSPPARQALAEIFDGTSLGERVVSYKIWKRDGTIVHASDKAVIGQQFPPSDDLREALSGRIASTFESLDDLENEAEAALGIPLLEVYSPIREVWTGRVIGVAEFYERADELVNDLRSAQTTSWLVIASVFLASGVVLLGIVQAGGRTIRNQKLALSAQLDETERVSRQNAELRERAVAASSRATAQTERAIRRVGFDLHDGPAQYLSLASLRMDSAFGEDDARSKERASVRDALNKALEEIRIISRGLALPDLDRLGCADLIERAISDHEKQTGLEVDIRPKDIPDPVLDYAQSLCVFRFLQETLSNVSRHSGAARANVSVNATNGALSITVSDDGDGFDARVQRTMRDDGGQGLYGLADRAESIGGTFDITSAPGKGTQVTLSLPIRSTANP